MNDALSTQRNPAPNVYFIDDSATMREVVKIAFRRENFNVITCGDMTSAIAQFEQSPPDAVISDVIMPDRDGYELCEFVKQHPKFGATPVILLSGIVNREVADKAHQKGADELMRKPFHPQELVACVKKLLKRGTLEPEVAAAPPLAAGSSSPLSQLFAGPTRLSTQSDPPVSPVAAVVPRAPNPPVRVPAPAKPAPPAVPAASSAEIAKLRAEVQRLEFLVKKLQAQLETEREYCTALESQLRALSVTE
jgi:DNA-binding response OmpR family regulator